MPLLRRPEPWRFARVRAVCEEAEWRCLLDSGAFIYTDGEPSGEWVEDRDGMLYPRDRVEECVEIAE